MRATNGAVVGADVVVVEGLCLSPWWSLAGCAGGVAFGAGACGGGPPARPACPCCANAGAPSHNSTAMTDARLNNGCRIARSPLLHGRQPPCPCSSRCLQTFRTDVSFG